MADAHIICTPDQLEEEFKQVIDLIKSIMKTLDIEIWYRYSKCDPKNSKNKYINNTKAWESSQKSMKKILDNMKIKYVEAEDEAAFYGPKLDLQYKDVYGKEDTLITVQIDFALPERFDLKYLDKDGKEKHPMVIHRSSIGATERVMAYLLEKNQGNFPLWLSPIQTRVITMSDEVKEYASEVHKKILEVGIRSEFDDSSESIGKKARNAIVEKVFYLVTVGEKEKFENKVAIRRRDSKEIDINLIDISPQHNVRTEKQRSNLEELKTSIQRIGLIHPVILIQKNGRFELVAGQRRFLAFKALGEKTIPSMVINDLDHLSKKILSFTENIQRAKTDPAIDIVSTGDEFDAKTMQVDFSSGFVDMWKEMRKEVLMITRVPPHWIGILDGANRGIGESVVIPYETKIKKIQQKIASSINKDFLPQLGLSNVKFKWNAISLMDEKSIVEIMTKLSAAGDRKSVG